MRVGLAFCGVLALAACVTQVRETASVSPLETAEAAALSLDLVNEKRQAAGLTPLRRDALLERAALSHAQDMAARGYFDHVSPEGLTPRGRLLAAGDCGLLTGENLAKGQSSLGKVIGDWMASDGHRKNMINPAFARGGLVQWGDIYVLTLSAAC